MKPYVSIQQTEKSSFCRGQGVFAGAIFQEDSPHTFDAAHDRVSEFAVFSAKKSRDYAANVPRDFLPRIPGVFPRPAVPRDYLRGIPDEIREK